MAGDRRTSAGAFQSPWRSIKKITAPHLLVQRSGCCATTTYRNNGRGSFLNQSLPSEGGDFDKAWKGLQLLDVRTEAEFTGVDRRMNARGGHIPGAKSLPHLAFYESDGRLKSKDAIRDMVTSLGFKDDHETPIVTICQAGIRASLAFGCPSARWL
jgi:thiosulfate/3-mercaptopyruvate sulfurtransferase